MNNIKVTVAQLIPKLGDKQHNLKLISETISKAASEKSNIAIFPELFLTGYSVGENISEMAETIDGPSMKEIRQQCQENQVYTVVGFPEDGQDGNYYISSALIDDKGDVLGVYRKMHLFDSENKYFKAGSNFEVIETPLGKIGLMICYDVEFPEISRALKLMGADIIIIVNANMHPYELHHHLYARCRAMENEIPVVICNRLGVEDALDFCGDSLVINAKGEILLSLKDEVIAKSVNIPTQQELDPKVSYIKNRRGELYTPLTR